MQDLWTKIAEEFAKSPVVAAGFTAGGAFIAACVSALVSSWVAHRSVYINAVTAERSKWIEALRRTVSKYSGAAGKIRARRDAREYDKTPEWAVDTEVLRTLLSDLTLRLNPRELEAQNLLRAARKLDQAARLHSSAAVILANEIMIRHAQWAAKAEWEQVKREASGWFARPGFAWRNWRRGAAYNKFLKHDGAMHRLDAIGAGKSDRELAFLRSQMDVPPTRRRIRLSRNLRRSVYKWRRRRLAARVLGRKGPGGPVLPGAAGGQG